MLTGIMTTERGVSHFKAISEDVKAIESLLQHLDKNRMPSHIKLNQGQIVKWARVYLQDQVARDEDKLKSGIEGIFAEIKAIIDREVDMAMNEGSKKRKMDTV